jgi:hypothetical protein
MPFKKTIFSIKEMLTQIKEDLWCKEVATGYTVTYTWMANQLGHFALGFAPTIILSSIATAIFGATPLIALVALLPALFMIYKEQGDIGVEKKRSETNPGIFPLNIGDIKKNAWTANLFTAVGAAVAGSVSLVGLIPVVGSLLPLIVLLGLTVPCLFVMRYWLTKKKCFQQAGLPFTYRLSYFSENKIKNTLEECQETINNFMEGNIESLIISGPLKSGKTTLGVSIGTELAFRQTKVRYIELFDLLESISFVKIPPVHFAYVLWDLADVDVLIIDDVDMNKLNQLDRLLSDENLANQFKSKKIVWLLDDNALITKLVYVNINKLNNSTFKTLSLRND